MKRFNWKPDLPDHRDLKYADHHQPLHLTDILPKSVDLRAQCSPVFDQGDIGSCTGNSLAGAIEFLELRELLQKSAIAPEEFGANFVNVSRLFIYWNERVLEGDPKQDGGAQIRDGIKTLASIGVCTEKSWPYNHKDLFHQPSQSCFSEASGHKISQYFRLESMDDMKHCLASGFPFAFGFTCYESLDSDAVASTGMLPMPQPDESSIGGHAVLAVGYDDDKQVFIVRNSWGESWGDKGYFYIPYAYIGNPDLADDFWKVQL